MIILKQLIFDYHIKKNNNIRIVLRYTILIIVKCIYVLVLNFANFNVKHKYLFHCIICYFHKH